MSLYGYSKPTNPVLEKMKLSQNLIVFDNVISPHNQTNLSLSKVLTFANYENANTPWFHRGNLVSIMNNAGYQSSWISNQESSIHATPAGIVSTLANSRKFLSEYKQNIDGVLLSPSLYQKLDEQLHFYVIHLIGAHATYYDRYPKEFIRFDTSSLDGKTRRIASYDNAIYYNDYIVSEIFKKFSNSDSIVIYISDHGEEVHERGEFAGHAEGIESRFMVEIPFLVYVSNQFIQKHPKTYELIKNAVHRPYMTDDLIHTILDIAGIQTEGFDSTRSIINPNFNPNRKRIVGGKDYDEELKMQKTSY